MRFRLAAILLALSALIGAPQSAMARAVSNEETASGIFPATSSLHARLESPQVPDRVPETSPRDYEPAPGRPKWPNRDPIGEQGGVNLSNFCRNSPINLSDFLGLDEIPPGFHPPQMPVRTLGTDSEDPGSVDNFIEKVKSDKESQNPCHCTKDLDINLHGNLSSLSTGGRSDPQTETNTVWVGMKMRKFGEDLKNAADLCKECEITLIACNQRTDEIAKDLHMATGCKIRYQGNVIYNSPDFISSEQGEVINPDKSTGRPEWHTFPMEIQP